MFSKFKDHYEEYLEYLKKTGKKKKTIQEYRRILNVIFPEQIREMRLSKLKRSDTALLIEAGILHGQHGATRVMVVFRRYFNFLQAELNIKVPFDWRDVKVPKVRYKEQPVFDDKEIAELFELMEQLEPGSVHGKRMNWTMYTLFETLFSTGMRIHEPLLLKRSQFTEIKEKKELLIMGKGNKERKVYFTDRAIAKLEEYINRRNDTNEALFVNSCGEELIMATARSYFERFKRKLNSLGRNDLALKLKSHTFRRTLATHLFENGADIKAVQNIMGHESERTTLKSYVRTNQKRAKLIHSSILSKIPYEELSKRYKEVDGKAMVRTTPNGGRWMPLDETASEELRKLLSNIEDDTNHEKGNMKKLVDALKGMMGIQYNKDLVKLN